MAKPRQPAPHQGGAAHPGADETAAHPPAGQGPAHPHDRPELPLAQPETGGRPVGQPDGRRGRAGLSRPGGEAGRADVHRHGQVLLLHGRAQAHRADARQQQPGHHSGRARGTARPPAAAQGPGHPHEHQPPGRGGARRGGGGPPAGHLHPRYGGSRHRVHLDQDLDHLLADQLARLRAHRGHPGRAAVGHLPGGQTELLRPPGRDPGGQVRQPGHGGIPRPRRSPTRPSSPPWNRRSSATTRPASSSRPTCRTASPSSGS